MAIYPLMKGITVEPRSNEPQDFGVKSGMQETRFEVTLVSNLELTPFFSHLFSIVLNVFCLICLHQFTTCINAEPASREYSLWSETSFCAFSST